MAELGAAALVNAGVRERSDKLARELVLDDAAPFCRCDEEAQQNYLHGKGKLRAKRERSSNSEATPIEPAGSS